MANGEIEEKLADRKERSVCACVLSGLGCSCLGSKVYIDSAYAAWDAGRIAWFAVDTEDSHTKVHLGTIAAQFMLADAREAWIVA